MNPYMADPDYIPPTDLYADVPLYGRYLPKPDDFRANLQYVNSQSPEAIQYWTSVLELCSETVRIYPAEEGGRDVFALGNIIVKSSHLHESPEINYEYVDANEVSAIDIAKGVLKNIRVPEIYFANKINGRNVLVQERLPGVTLGVAWPYISQSQKQSFKEQAQSILRQLHTIKPDSDNDSDLGFMHNDFTQSNIIVDDDKIVGIIDWEMAGFFSWKTAGEIHKRIRTPQREHFVNIMLNEETLQDMMFWNDLYDDC